MHRRAALTLPEAIESFAVFCQAERGLADKTCKTYRSWLMDPIIETKAAGDDTPQIGDVNQGDARRFLRESVADRAPG